MREIWFKWSYKGGRQLRALLPARALCSLRSQVAARHRRDVEWVRQADFYRRHSTRAGGWMGGGDNTVWCWMLAELVGWSAAPVAGLMCRVLALGGKEMQRRGVGKRATAVEHGCSARGYGSGVKQGKEENQNIWGEKGKKDQVPVRGVRERWYSTCVVVSVFNRVSLGVECVRIRECEQ